MRGHKALIYRLVFGLLVATGLTGSASAQTTSPRTVFITNGQALNVPVATPYDKIIVSDPDVAVAAPVTNREFYIRGLQVGTTNILTYTKAGTLNAMLDIRVMPNLSAIRNDLAILFPYAEVQLNAVANKVHVRGTVDDPETYQGILDVVESHVPGQTLNALKTKLPAQVLLEVRFVEASRDDIREFGFGSEISRPGDFTVFTGAGLLSGAGAKTAATLFGGSGDVSIDVFLQALEEEGVVRTLAEPNLVSRSGQPASFLAGGEFPVPVASQNDAVTIEFKNFGVGLEFTPTVLSEDRIILDVAPEVSGLDPRNSVRLADVEIPALTVRKLNTQIEIGSGESFAIAGLIQNDYQASEAATPFLGEIPILGALFRSSRFKRNETELVVIITPHLVKPALRDTRLSTPADLVPPVAPERGLLTGEMHLPTEYVAGAAVQQNIEHQQINPRRQQMKPGS